MSQFAIHRAEIQGIPVLLLDGYFDDDAGQLLENTVQEVTATGSARLIIDFGKVHTLTSLGISHLITITTGLEELPGGSMAFSGLNPTQVRVFDMSGLLRVVGHAPTPAEAASLLASV